MGWAALTKTNLRRKQLKQQTWRVDCGPWPHWDWPSPQFVWSPAGKSPFPYFLFRVYFLDQDSASIQPSVGLTKLIDVQARDPGEFLKGMKEEEVKRKWGRKHKGLQLMSECKQDLEAADFSFGVPWSDHFEGWIHLELGILEIKKKSLFYRWEMEAQR